jgi:DNA-binding transcriptional regulator YiaG
MTPTDFRNTLARLGLSQTGASRVLGVSDRQVRRWASGDISVPQPVVIILKLLCRGVIGIDDLQKD